MVETTMAEARAAWDDRVIIFGGIQSVMLEDPYTDEQLERFVEQLFSTIGPGKAFILGISDNAMPDSKIERIERETTPCPLLHHCVTRPMFGFVPTGFPQVPSSFLMGSNVLLVRPASPSYWKGYSLFLSLATA